MVSKIFFPFYYNNDYWQFCEHEKWLFFMLFDVYPFFIYHKTWTEKEDKTFIIPMVSQSGYLIKHSTTKTSIKIKQTKSGTGKMSKWIVRENEKGKEELLPLNYTSYSIFFFRLLIHPFRPIRIEENIARIANSISILAIHIFFHYARSYCGMKNWVIYVWIKWIKRISYWNFIILTMIEFNVRILNQIG